MRKQIRYFCITRGVGEAVLQNSSPEDDWDGNKRVKALCNQGMEAVTEEIVLHPVSTLWIPKKRRKEKQKRSFVWKEYVGELCPKDALFF